MLEKAVMLFLALILMTGASAGFAAEKTNDKTGKTVKTEHSKYPAAYEKAILAAKSEVPVTAIFQGMSAEQETDKTIAFSFYDNNTLRAYEVTVIKEINKVKTVKIGGSNLSGSATVNKTVEDIEEIVSLEYPDGKITAIEQKYEGNLSYYEAQVETQRFTADLKINPVTGAIGSRVLEYKIDTPSVKCSKCGWKPADSGSPPNFCPECGHPFQH